MLAVFQAKNSWPLRYANVRTVPLIVTGKVVSLLGYDLM